jgi:hypothetical protein
MEASATKNLNSGILSIMGSPKESEFRCNVQFFTSFINKLA